MAEETTETPIELTNAQYNEAKVLEIEAKQKELEEKFKCQIFPIELLKETGGKITYVGYMKKPSLRFQMSYTDMLLQSQSMAGEMILENCIIKEESDPETYTATDENSENYLGAIKVAQSMVTYAYNKFKKK